MKTMLLNLLVVIVLVAAAYVIGRHQGQSIGRDAAVGIPAAAAGNAPDGPTATVRTAVVRQGKIAQTLEAFGIVKAQQGEISFISVPLESRVNRLMVVPGQHVTADQTLFELEVSQTQLVATAQAKINAETTTAQLKQVEQKKSEQLATNQELTQAQQAAAVAKAIYDQMVKQTEQTLAPHTSGFDGVVNKLNAQPGQLMPAGSAIVEVVSQKGIEVQLGVEAGDVRLLQAGQTIEITSVLDNSSASLKATVRLVSQSIDPQTRMADVYALLPADSHLLLGQYVRASTAVDVKEGLIVPRQAVLPNGANSIVYSVRDGKAMRHIVQSGIDNGDEVQIYSTEITAGMSIVTVGIAQMADGMNVTVAPEASNPAAGPAPATTPAAGSPLAAGSAPVDSAKNAGVAP